MKCRKSPFEEFCQAVLKIQESADRIVRKYLVNRILVLEERIDRENNEKFDDNYVEEQQSYVPLPDNNRVMPLTGRFVKADVH